MTIAQQNTSMNRLKRIPGVKFRRSTIGGSGASRLKVRDSRPQYKQRDDDTWIASVTGATNGTPNEFDVLTTEADTLGTGT